MENTGKKNEDKQNRDKQNVDKQNVCNKKYQNDENKAMCAVGKHGIGYWSRENTFICFYCHEIILN